MPDSSIYSFGDFTLDVRNRQLRRGDQQLPLNARYFDALVMLVRRRGRLVSKDELFTEVWDGLLVTDSALTQCIRAVRRCLGDAARHPRYIKTVPKHGYMFIAAVEAAPAGQDAAEQDVTGRDANTAQQITPPLPLSPLAQAQAVLDRSLANHRDHGLLISDSALEVLLPYGDRLMLRGDAAALLSQSVLAAGRTFPRWLAAVSPDLRALLAASLAHPGATVRLQALRASSQLVEDEAAALLVKAALWDTDADVRTAAAVALARRFGATARPQITSADAPFSGRRAMALALVREHDRTLVPFSSLPVLLILLVGFSLVLLRLRRQGLFLQRQVMGAVAGGAASGLVGGLVYGLGFALARPSLELSTPSFILVFASLGVLISALGACGVGFGMLAAGHLTYRHSRWWTVAGGAAGGAAVGAFGRWAGTAVLLALVGQAPADVTGAAEGAAIGMALAIGAVLAGPLHPVRRPAIAGAALATMLASIGLSLAGANLFIGSIAEVVHMFTHALLQVDVLAQWFGEAQFGRFTQTILSALEGLTFGAAVMGGIYLAGRRTNRAASRTEAP